MLIKIAVLALILGFVASGKTGLTMAVAQTPDRPINLMLSTLPPGQDPQRYNGYVEPKYKELTERSIYVTMRDGVKIAITVVLPKGLPANERIPALMHMTRYWRAQQGHSASDSGTQFFCGHGYATVL